MPSTNIKDYYRRAWGLKDRPGFKYGGSWADWKVNYEDQMTFEEYLQDDNIVKKPHFLDRKAKGGRIGYEKGLLVSDLTPQELVNAQSAARKQGITGKKGSKEFADFVGGDTYKRQKTIIKETAEEFGYTYDEYIKLSESEKNKLYNQKYTKASKVKAGNIAGDSVEEVIVQLQNGGKFSKKQKEKKMLYDTYSKLFREEFDKLKNFNEPFSRSDLTRSVIRRIEELYTTPDGYFNEEFLPSRQIDNKSWYDFIKPGAKADKKKAIFSDKELKLFSQEGVALKKTKTQEKIFDLLADGVNEMDDIAVRLNLSRTKVKHELDKMLVNMFSRKDTPVFLNETRKARYSDVINALESSDTLDGFYRRNIKTVISETFPNDPDKRSAAYKKVKEFDNVIKNLQNDFPGLKINYDHPASYRALKNQNLKGFLNITPIMKDINTFKSQFDLRSQLNLAAMEDALAAGNMDEYKRLLKNQRGIEKLWSTLTGGQSSLGKVRLGKATNLGTTALLDESKDLIKEFKGNIQIRENIAKNLNEDTIKQFKTLFPVKRGETALIKSAQTLTSPELIEQDKKIKLVLEKGSQNIDPSIWSKFINSTPVKIGKGVVKAGARTVGAAMPVIGPGLIAWGLSDVNKAYAAGLTDPDDLAVAYNFGPELAQSWSNYKKQEMKPTLAGREGLPEIDAFAAKDGGLSGVDQYVLNRYK